MSGSPEQETPADDWRLSIGGLRAHGERQALAGQALALSYRQLAARALGVADALDAAGVGPGDRVALLSAKRAADEAVGLCGVLAAGAVPVPLDHGSPGLRLGGILQDSGCRALVHDEASADLARSVAERLLRIELDEEGLVLASLGHAPEGCPRDPQLACVLHTSGSSGKPKAVPISHDGLNAFVGWLSTQLDLSADDRVLRVAELVFDLAWFDHIATFRAGATLCLLSRRELAAGGTLATAWERIGPSVVYGVPSLFVKLSEATEGPLTPCPRIVCFAGEVFAPRQLAAFAKQVPGAQLYNLYGPTETNVCTYHHVRPADLDGTSELAIGLACPYAACAIHDESGAVVEGPGVGELVVRGPTALGGEVSTRDRVERKADGLFYFRGRMDRVVKLRGYRVDPAEVEAAIATHPAVREAAVTVSEHRRLGLRLTGWVALHETDLPSASQALRRHLAARLASYMVPDKVVVLDALPRTTTGKVDYRALATRG